MRQQSWPVTVTFNANGAAIAPMQQRTPGTRYKVVQIVVTTTSAVQTVAQVQRNSEIICTSQQGNNDAAAGEPSIDIASSDALQVVWNGGTPGAKATATFIYEPSD